MASLADYKRALEFAVDDVLQMALRDKRISEDNVKAAKSFLQQSLSSVNEEADVLKLLEAMAKKWSVITPLVHIEKERMHREHQNVPKSKVNFEKVASFAERRKELEDDLLDFVLDSLETGRLVKEDSQQIARYVLDHIDGIQNEKQRTQFLQDLADKWSIFYDIIELERGKQHHVTEEAVAVDVVEMLKSGHTKQAIAAADTAMNDTG